MEYYYRHRDEIQAKRRKHPTFLWHQDQLLACLKKYVTVTPDMLVNISGYKRRSLHAQITLLRNQGYKIKFAFGKYHYGGRHNKAILI